MTSTGVERVTFFPKTASLSGRLINFECLGQGARLHIEAEGSTRLFAVVDPNSIVIVSSQGGEVEFACGPQNGRAIRIEYGTEAPEGFDAEGAVTLIEFPD